MMEKGSNVTFFFLLFLDRRTTPWHVTDTILSARL